MDSYNLMLLISACLLTAGASFFVAFRLRPQASNHVESAAPEAAAMASSNTLQKERMRVASELTLAEDMVRGEISRMLHDELGQSLVVGKLRLRKLSKSVANDPVAAAQVKEITDIVDQLLTDIRSVSQRVKPHALAELGLGAALVWQAEQIETQFGIKFEVWQPERKVPVAQGVALVIFYGVRELMYNAAKHSGSRICRIRLDCGESLFSITVEDNGKGFIPEEAGANRQGLRFLRERMQAIGAGLEFEVIPNQYTRVKISYPLYSQLGTEH